ncbi:1-acyl-sn-glycerol-3-phosphate acyltransferase [Olleya sp. R77988]|uniref:1-acyl-sn-glycerol-3-phosphate acyltransferase n=1 Tax=Olleya sp. R77988 TaxID=3093875 RepID=UPI0037C9B46C
MKKIWLHSVKLYIQIGLFFYYKKIKLEGIQTIPKNQPVLFLGNHQNALLDPLLIATKSGRICYFLTRAAVFKKPMVSRILNSLNMLPVYRVRDGWSTITKNKSVFSKSVELLHKNNAITIFPEGSHNLLRRVRPLSKGFTRIVLELRDKYPDTNINLIPVGFNYDAPKVMGSSVSINFGKPIASSLYSTLNEADATKQIKHDVFRAMSSLTTQIPEDGYETILKQLTDLNVDFTNPNLVNKCIKSNFKDCQSSPKRNSFVKAFLKPVIYLILCVPVLVWQKLAKPKVEELEFLSTFRFAICITLVPLWLLILFGIAVYGFGITLALIGFVITLLLLLAYNKT